MESIRVGTFDLYPSERVLSVGGKPVELGARAFDLLLVLAEHPGRLVTKATLLERVWPRVIVDENNLPAQIAGLRRVLGADAIRTVPGFGYRLELPVSNTVIPTGPVVTPGSEMAGGAVPPQDVATSVMAPAVAERLRLPIARRTWPNRLGCLVGRE